MATDFEIFSNLISRWAGAYTFAVHSYVAVKTIEGPRLLYGIVFLKCSQFEEVPFTFETEHVVAGRFARVMSQFDFTEAITKAKDGRMDGRNEVIALAPPSGNQFSTYLPHEAQPLNSAFSIRGETRHNLLQKVNTRSLDEELRAAKTPFDSLKDLLEHCGLPCPTYGVETTTLEIVASSPGIIEACSTIMDGKATIECRVASALNVGELRLGYIAKTQNVIRGSIAGNSMEWRKNGDFQIGTCRLTVGDAPFLRTYLTYGEIPLHYWPVSNPRNLLNLRYAVHQALDPDLEFVKEMLLRPQKRNSESFEPAVSSLFTQIGFCVENYGRIPKLQDGPDIIAFTPSGNVAVVECTLGILDNKDKLAKVVQRTKMIEEKVVQAGHTSTQVQAVMVSPLSPGELAADLKRAAEHRVAVVCKPDLEKALEQVLLMPDAERFFQELRNSIPKPGLESILGR